VRAALRDQPGLEAFGPEVGSIPRPADLRHPPGVHPRPRVEAGPGPIHHPGARPMSAPAAVPLDLPDGDVVFYPAFFPAPDADRLLRELLDTTAWRQDSLRLYGRDVNLPRLTAWYGDEGT